MAITNLQVVGSQQVDKPNNNMTCDTIGNITQEGGYASTF
jgi:hypothetical protein